MAQSTTMPNGEPPPGMAIGEPLSSVRAPPSLARTLIFATPASTTYRYESLGSSWASNARRPLPDSVVLPVNASPPPWPIEYEEMLELPVLTAKSLLPSWLIATQQGAVWKSAKGEPPIGVRVPSAATS